MRPDDAAPASLDLERRRFFGAAAATLAAAPWVAGAATADPAEADGALMDALKIGRACLAGLPQEAPQAFAQAVVDVDKL